MTDTTSSVAMDLRFTPVAETIEDNDAQVEAPQATHDQAASRIRFGQQLREARERRDVDLETCGRTLRLPARILCKLEAGDYHGISDPVYLRDYLASYGACVGLPAETVRAAIRELVCHESKPTLVPTGGIPHSRYLWQRYTTAATYAVLTAVIVVPLVWLGLNGGLNRGLTKLQPLDASAQGATVAQTGAGGSAAAAASGNAIHAARTPASEQPLMASMAPFSALSSVDVAQDARAADPSAAAAPAAPTAVAGSHTLHLVLAKASWVAITTADGKRLEYSLLPAGTDKVYHSTKPLEIDIGDAAGATVSLDGKDVDLATYQRANVAHFRVALNNGKASAQSM